MLSSTLARTASFSPVAACATRKSSLPPTSGASQWASPENVTSGTEKRAAGGAHAAQTCLGSATGGRGSARSRKPLAGHDGGLAVRILLDHPRQRAIGGALVRELQLTVSDRKQRFGGAR